MKKIILFAITLSLLLTLFVSCSSDLAENGLKNDMIDAWHTVTGGDSHSIEIKDDNTIYINDGGDVAVLVYTVLSEDEIMIDNGSEEEIETLKLEGDILVRYINNEKDGYTYEKSAS